MSGGHFDYYQFRIDDIADSIEDYIYGHPLEEEDVEYYIEDNWLENEEKEYIIKNKHTIPNYYGYNEETLEEFKKGLDILRKACIYAQRIDWLLSGDDGEESFHKRLKEDLENIIRKQKNNFNIMANINKTFVKSYKDYKEVLDWCKNIGTVTDDYGNKIQPHSWLYCNNLTKNDFGKDKNRNDKQCIIWNTNKKQDLYLIRYCPCKIVQKRMREVYSPDYINDVLNFNTEFDK